MTDYMASSSFLRLAFLAMSLLTLTASSYAQFGQNKVQFKEFNWSFTSSNHFDIYYYQGGEYLARFAKVELEKSLTSIEATLNFKIGKKVSVILYNSHNEFQQTNVINQMLPEGVGGVTEAYKNRVVLPFEGNYSQFRHVLHHELVHAVLNQMFLGGTIQTAISNNRRAELPLWMNEGFAEYESIGGLDTKTDQFMRDAMLNNIFDRGFDNLQGYYAYRGGQAFYWWVSERYGKEKVAELINKIKNVGDLNSAFKSTFNLTYDEFSDYWVEEMKKEFFPDIGTFEMPKDFAERLTDHKKKENSYNTSPAISPDGDKMAFIADEDGFYNIYVQKISSTGKEKPQLIISSDRAQDFEDLNLLTPGISWDPAGKKIAITAKSRGEDALYIYDLTREDYERIQLGFAQMSSAQWSPDGKSILFVASQNESSDIYLYLLDSKKLNRLTNDVFTDLHPTWSVDGKLMFFVSDRGDNVSGDFTSKNFAMWKHNINQQDIFSLEIESLNISRLTTTEVSKKTSVCASPDGSKLLYVSDDNGIGNIYITNLADKKTVALTNSLQEISQLSLSRDASKLLFVSQNNGGYDIFLLRSPFTEKRTFDSLTSTKLRIRERKQRAMAVNVLQNALRDTIVPTVGLGEVKIDFTRQQFSQVNGDVQTSQDDESLSADLSDTTFTSKEYKIQFSPDLILGNAGYSSFWGFQGVTQMLFSDLMGDHQIYATTQFLYDLKNSSFAGSYFYLPKNVDYEVSVAHTAYLFQTSNFDPDQSINFPFANYRFRFYGIDLSAWYPLDRFNRIQWGIGWKNLMREHSIADSREIEQPTILRTIFMPNAQFVHDNSEWGIFSPFRGSRYFVGGEGSPLLGASGIGFFNLSFDARTYIPLLNITGFAFRAAGATSFGRNPNRFMLGGTENWITPVFGNGNVPFENPEDFAFMRFVMPLRGWNINEVAGTKYLQFNGELRFPLFVPVGPLSALLPFVLGNIFLDVGTTWTDQLRGGYYDPSAFIPGGILLSTGVGLRTVLFGFPVKFDVAWRRLETGFSVPIYLVSLGLDY